MTDFVIKKLSQLLKSDKLDDYENEILEYGITTVCLNLPKTILLIFIAKKLNLLKPLLLIFIFYGAVRNYSRGIHARTPLVCFLVGTAQYLSMAYLSKVLTIPLKVYNAVYAYCFYIYWRYAPSGTEVNPVYKDQIRPLKKRALLIVVASYLIGLKGGIIRNITMLSMLAQSFYIIPLTYKLANQKGGLVHEDEEEE